VSLAHDWKAIARRPKAKVKPPNDNVAVDEIHEDWIAIKGDKHPAYAFLVRWEYPTAFAIFKLRVVGKRRMRHGTEYLTRGHSTLYKTPGMEIYPEDKPSARETTSWPRHLLCFTVEDVDQHIASLRLQHIDRLRMDLMRYVKLAEEVARAMACAEEYIRAVRDDPVPYNIRDGLPKKESKRTRT
jgi:hypothetical protein